VPQKLIGQDHEIRHAIICGVCERMDDKCFVVEMRNGISAATLSPNVLQHVQEMPSFS
jgi:hypothetical protein